MHKITEDDAKVTVTTTLAKLKAFENATVEMADTRYQARMAWHAAKSAQVDYEQKLKEETAANDAQVAAAAALRGDGGR